MATEPILDVRDLAVEFDTRHGPVRAVNGVSFDLRAGETLGIVGESGSGKSVTALSILGLLPRNARVTAGSIKIHGRELVGLPEIELRRLRGRVVSMVLQDPMTSLNPVFSISWQVGEAVQVVSGMREPKVTQRVVDLLGGMRIPAPRDRMRSFPHELSGGQRQRVAIARALSLDPALVILDEPVSSLDVSIRSQITNLLRDLQERRGVTYFTIGHHLASVAYVSQHIAVMYLGRIVEILPSKDLLHARHPYTRALLAASLPSHPRRRGRPLPISGEMPSPYEIPTGCRFRSRCPEAMPICVTADPQLLGDTAGSVACHLFNGGSVG